VGALFCRTDAFNAACCGAFVNGEAGDVAFAKKGYGLLATDVIEHITDIMRQ
jgi:NAD(P)H-hydrate epimerase